MLTKEINSHPANNLSEREKAFKCIFLVESRLREQLSFYLKANSSEIRSVPFFSAAHKMLGNLQHFGFLNIWSFRLWLVHFRSVVSLGFSRICLFRSLGRCWFWCAAVGKLQLDCCLILGFPFGPEGMSCFDFFSRTKSVALNEGSSAADNLGTCFEISFQKQSERLRMQNLF